MFTDVSSSETNSDDDESSEEAETLEVSMVKNKFYSMQTMQQLAYLLITNFTIIFFSSENITYKIIDHCVFVNLSEVNIIILFLFCLHLHLSSTGNH